jgi:hypothetical protein
MNVFPGEWYGIKEYEDEFKKKLENGDLVKVIIDSQLMYLDGFIKKKRRYNEIGKIIDIDQGDEWAYQLIFDDGETNWFKRYALQKM